MSPSRRIGLLRNYMLLCGAIVLLCGVIVLPVLAAADPASSLSSAPALAPDAGALALGADSERARVVALDSLEAQSARDDSRTAFAGLSRAGALQAGQEAFPQEFTADLPDGQPPAGMKIVKALDARDTVDETSTGKKLLVTSPTPLEAATQTGSLKPVDLSLTQDATSFSPSNSLSDMQIAKTVRDGVTFAQGDFSIAPSTANNSSALQSDGRVFYASTNTDTDFLVTPQPAGAELSWQIRSPDAPQAFALNVDMPAGAVLRRAVSDHPIAGDPPTAIEIDQGTQTLGYVYAPIAYDSDGTPVPSQADIVGNKIVIHVEHHDQDLHYPLLVDPQVTVMGGYTQPISNGWDGWIIGRVPGFASPGSNYYAATVNDCAYYCGLYLGMPPNTLFDAHGTWAAWDFKAPANTYIYRAVLGTIAHHPFTALGYTFSRWYDGIMNAAGTAWETPVSNVDQTGATGPNPFGPVATAAGNVTHDFCFVTRCNAIPSGNHDGNQAIFGFYAENSVNTNRIATGSGYGAAGLGTAQIYLGDNHPPAITGAAPGSKPWTDDASSLSHTLTATAHDDGVGLSDVTLGGIPGQQPQVSSKTCASTQNRPCLIDASFGPFTYTLPEGVNTLTLTAHDAVGNASPAQTWTERIDRSKPRDPVLSGSAWDARTQTDANGDQVGGLFADQATLKVAATDDNSGVASIELLIDGQRTKPEYLASMPNCTANGCPTTASASFSILRSDLATGDHTVTVAVRDQFGDAKPASHSTISTPFTLYSLGIDTKTDPSATTPDEDSGANTVDETPSATCDPDPDFAAGDQSCLPDESSTNVAAVRAEPQADSPLQSLLLVGDSILDPTPPATPRQVQPGCDLGDPITRKVSVAAGRRFGLSDQSSFAEIRDHGFPDIFIADPRPPTLNVQRVRLTVPWNLIAQRDSGKPFNCAEYHGAYTWIKNAVEASPQREPVISFERASAPHPDLPSARPGPTAYRSAIQAFMQQFPAVRVFTAWNEPNHKNYQPTTGNTTDLSAQGARAAGKYWRIANDLCQQGRKCIVAAGDFLDDASFNDNYRSNYFKGMGSPQHVAVWAYHPYGAIKWGPGSTQIARLTRFLASPRTQGSEIWFTESGAFANLITPGQPNYSPEASLGRQSSDLSNFLNLPDSPFKDPRVKRFYYYNWVGGQGFDTGLVGNLDQTPPEDAPDANPATSTPRTSAPARPVFCTLKARTNPGAPC